MAAQLTCYRLPPDGSCAQRAAPIVRGHGWRSSLIDWPEQRRPHRRHPERARGRDDRHDTGARGRPRPARSTPTCTRHDGVVVFDVRRTDRSGYLAARSAPTAAHVQTVVTALDWDDNGQRPAGRRHDAVDPDGARLQAVRVSVDGRQCPQPARTNCDTSAESHRPVTVVRGGGSSGRRVPGGRVRDGRRQREAVGSGGDVEARCCRRSPGRRRHPVDALTFTDRIDGTVGVPDLVAVSQPGQLGPGAALQRGDDPGAAPGGRRRRHHDRRRRDPRLVPRLQDRRCCEFHNVTRATPRSSSTSPTRPNAAYGCWFSQGFDGLPPLPTTPVIVGPRRISPTYTIGVLTAGEGGDCAATDFTGQWAAYVVVTPLGRPADRTVAKLVWSRSGQLTVQSVGGSLKLVVAPRPPARHPLGDSDDLHPVARAAAGSRPASTVTGNAARSGRHRPPGVPLRRRRHHLAAAGEHPAPHPDRAAAAARSVGFTADGD